MKTALIVLTMLLLSQSANALIIVDYRKSKKGLFGYDYVSSTYVGVINGNHNWQVVCENPGFIRCKRNLFSTGDVLDDLAMSAAEPFLDAMDDDIDRKSTGGLAEGTWNKTIVTHDLEGRVVNVYVKSTWSRDADGAVNVHVEIAGVYQS